MIDPIFSQQERTSSVFKSWLISHDLRETSVEQGDVTRTNTMGSLAPTCSLVFSQLEKSSGMQRRYVQSTSEVRDIDTKSTR